MNVVAPVLATPAAVNVPVGTAPSGPVSTLPTGDAHQDMLASLFLLASKMSSDELEREKTEIVAHRGAEQLADARRAEELRKAQEEANKGGFFHWVEKDMGVLGVAGLCTFNYGLVAADVAMHKTGLVHDLKLDVTDAASAWAFQAHPELLVADLLVRKLDVAPSELKKEVEAKLAPFMKAGLGDEDVKPVVAKAVEVNLLVAGAAASVLSAGTATALVVALAAAAMSAGAFVSQEAGGPLWLTMGLGIGSAALSLGSGLESARAGIQAADAARVTAAKAAGVAVSSMKEGADGADEIVNAVHDKAHDDAMTNAEEARMQIAQIQRLLDGLIDAMKETQASQKRTREIINGALTTYANTLDVASNLKA